MRKQTVFLTKRLLRLLVLLVLVAVIAAGTVLVKPIWVSALITKELKNHGIHSHIDTLTSSFSGTSYQLTGQFSAKADALGIDIAEATLSASVDWYALINGEPFVNSINVGHSKLAIDRHKLAQQFSGKNNQPQDFQRIVPQQWHISDTHVSIDGHTLTINGSGDGDQRATLVASDSNDDELHIVYDKAQHQLSLDSQQLNLKAFTGQPATLHQLSASINTQNWLASRATTTLDYRGMTSHIGVTGNADSLSIRAQSNGQAVNVVAKPIDNNRGVLLTFDDVDLAVFQSIAPLLPSRYEWPRLNGTVNGTLTMQRKIGLHSAQLTLDNVGVAHDSASINHVYGDVSYSDGIVRFLTQLQKSQARMPSQFPHPPAPLSGKINGTFDVNTLSLGLQSINLRSDDFDKLTATGTFDLKQYYIDLSAHAENVDIAKNQRLIPTIMPKEVRHFLAKALVSGKKNRSELNIRGPLLQLFRDKNAQFLLQSSLRDSVFHYLDNNPDINISEGTLTIDGRRLHVDVSKADIQGVPLTGNARIADFFNTEVVVNAGLSNQSIQRLLPIAEKSLAKDSIKLVKQMLTAKGTASVNLALNLPLSDDKKSHSFDVEVTGDNLSLHVNDYPQLPIKRAHATVSVNEKGLQQVSVRGQYNKEPVKVTVARDKQQNYRTHVDITGNAINLLQHVNLLSQAQAAVLRKHQLLQGQSLFSTKLVFNDSGQLQHTTVNSTLQGTSLNTFGLVNKTAKTKLPLALTFDEKNKKLTASLEKRLALTAGFNQRGQLAGLLLDNRQQKNSYKRGAVKLYWYGKRLDLENFNQLREALAKTQKKQKSPPTLDYEFDLAIDAIKLGKDAIYPLKMYGNLGNLTVNSPLATGKIHYSPNRLEATFKQLNISHLIQLYSKTEINPEGREVSKIDLAKALPQMQVTVEKLLYKGSNVGDATVRTSIQGGRYSIDQIFIRGENYFFEASGFEADEPQGITTKIQADFKGEDIRQIVSLLKLNPVLDGKFIDLSANLSWPGKAHTLNLRQSYGKASLNAQNVKLVNISAGVGSVVGLMDIASILKRISLDFQNLSSSKISFDTVQGNWNIGGGRAVTRNAYATGSLVELKIVGAVDLYRRQFDNVDVTVIPKASNVIPVVGAVAGGVVGAVIGVVVQQVAGDAMNSAVGLPYVISGTWDKPVMTSGSEPPKPTNVIQSIPPGPITLESLQ